MEIEQHNLEKQLSPRWILDSQTLKYLQNEYSFSNKELNQWYKLFRTAQKELDLLKFLAEKKRYVMEAKNPKGYLIHCLKNELGKNSKQEKINEVQQELDFELDFLDPAISPDLTQEEAKTIVE